MLRFKIKKSRMWIPALGVVIAYGFFHNCAIAPYFNCRAIDWTQLILTFSIVLGLGGAVSFLAGDHPSAGVSPTNRWLWWRWNRRRRASDLRSLLLRWHVDEKDEDLARVNAGSGSYNLDAPYLARQRCRGNRSTNTYGTGRPGPFPVRQGGGDRTKSGSRRSTRAVYPASELSREITLLLLHV